MLVVRFEPAVVHGEFLEVAEHAEREFGGPGVAAELERGTDVVLDINRRPLCLQEEFAGAADAEGVIGRFGGLADFDGVLVDDVFVRLRVALLIVHVPAERLEERVEEFAAELRFVVVRRAVGFAIAVEPLDQLQDLRRWLVHQPPRVFGETTGNSRLLGGTQRLDYS